MTTCAHCDGSGPHEHPDVPAIVRDRRGSLTAWAAGGAAAWLVLAGVPLAVASGAGTGTTALAHAGLGALAWAAATGTGLLTAGWLQRRPTRGPLAGLVGGTLATAAVTPLLALGVALVADPGSGASALRLAYAAAGGWLTGGLVAETVRHLRLRSLLLAQGPDGEAARDAAVAWNQAGRRGPAGGRRPAGPGDGGRLAGAVLGAAAFGAWVALLAGLPALVLVLVPLQVGVAALLARQRVDLGHASAPVPAGGQRPVS